FIKLPVKARELNDSPKETPAKDPVTTRSMAGQVFTQPTQVQSKPLPPRPLLLASGVVTNSSPDTNGPAPVTEPVKPSFPSVRLQGIFYRARNPSAVINAKSVFVGEKVAGAKVVAITRDSATL